MTVFIGPHNIAQFAKVQSAKSYGNRDKVILLWDELDRKQKNQAKKINIELEVETEDPSSVPDKWNDCTVKVGDSLDTTDIVKMIIANPSRYDVYELLRKEQPPEPLILWWLDKVYSDEDYFRQLADICHYGLFKTNSDYLWATIAFGVDEGVGRFHWPESEKESTETKNIKKELSDKYNVDENEIDKLWDTIEDISDEILSKEQENDSKADPNQNNKESNNKTRSSSLLDL